MEITTPLGDDLLFHGMHAREELSRLFEYQVDLLSPNAEIDLDRILGQHVTVRLLVSEDSTRYFSGHVTRFTQSGTLGRYHRYSATVSPWLWFLTRTADCRIFQDKTVPDILRDVFADHAMADVTFELTGSYRTWTYCVQYRETDFNFVSRLMEQEGIYYYFRHTDGHDTMVLADSTSSHRTAPGYEQVRFVAPEEYSRPEAEVITSWTLSRAIQPGVYVHDDYDMERPSVELRRTTQQPRNYSPSDYEVYDYPGEYLQTADGDHYATVRMEELATQFETAQAETTCRGLGAGHLFTLDGGPRSDQDREHLVVAASYDLAFGGYEGLPGGSEAASFACRFTAMSSQQQFRPARTTPKPFVQGPQTAVIVGPPGDEIYTDQYGRVKVQFHWDRRGEKNENSSCWMRVSYPWAGKAWGGIQIPRIGQEVIVDFLEGDPDQPIITGRVYNTEHMPPYDLPAKKTQSGMKSRSSKDGAAEDFNEIRFEDLKGKEEIYVHAEKDFTRVVENNDALKVGFEKKSAGNQIIEVYHDQNETVGNNQTVKIGGPRGGSQTIEIAKDQKVTLKRGDRTVTVEMGNDSLRLKMGNRSVKLDLGKISEEAMQSIEFKVGQSSVKIDQTGVTVKGMLVKIEGTIQTQVKGLMTQVNGDAMLTAKGGIVMIG
jgi:type VI secretion system secreted protein VgrG